MIEEISEFRLLDAHIPEERSDVRPCPVEPGDQARLAGRAPRGFPGRPLVDRIAQAAPYPPPFATARRGTNQNRNPSAPYATPAPTTRCARRSRRSGIRIGGRWRPHGYVVLQRGTGVERVALSPFADSFGEDLVGGLGSGEGWQRSPQPSMNQRIAAVSALTESRAAAHGQRVMAPSEFISRPCTPPTLTSGT